MPKAKPQSTPAKRTSRASRHPTPRRRRVTAKYRPYLARIAELWVGNAHNASQTARLVRERLHLDAFKPGYLKQWMGVPEFAAMVRAEEERQAADSVTSPFVRGPYKIRWLVEVEQVMRESYDAADVKEAGKPLLLAAIHRLSAELRAEELFLGTMKEKRARQSLAVFLRNLLRFGKETGAPPSVWRFLERALGKLDYLIGGGTELVDADVVVRMLYARLNRATDTRTGVAVEDMQGLSDEQVEALARGGNV